MEMELYNTTDKTKVIPKFNYEGKMTMGPHESKKIEDYMAPFYKPYARVGIVVRPAMKLGTFSPKDFVEPEVEEAVKEVKVKENPVEVKKEVKESKPEKIENVEKKKESTSKEPVKEELVKEVVEEKVNEKVEDIKEEPKKYTKEKLMEKSVKNLRILADSLGVDLGNATKKADIADVILASQK